MVNVGRPSLYSEQVADSICERIAEGESLRMICEAEGMPHRLTVIRWLAAHPEFATKHAHAREAQSELMDEKIEIVANDCTPENAPAARVKIDAYKWRAAKLAPKRFGDKTFHAGDKDNPIETRNTTVLDVKRLSDDALREVAALGDADPS